MVDFSVPMRDANRSRAQAGHSDNDVGAGGSGGRGRKRGQGGGRGGNGGSNPPGAFQKSARCTGRLTTWDSVTGRGTSSLSTESTTSIFRRSTEGTTSIFVSKRALRAPLGSDALAVGTMVEFTIGANKRGLNGVDVTLARSSTSIDATPRLETATAPPRDLEPVLAATAGPEKRRRVLLVSRRDSTSTRGGEVRRRRSRLHTTRLSPHSRRCSSNFSAPTTSRRVAPAVRALSTPTTPATRASSLRKKWYCPGKTI